MDKNLILKELVFKAVKSSGPGGQHVNKTASKVELTFSLNDSSGLSDDEKKLLSKTLSNKISTNGLIKLQCDTARSQHKNKEIVQKRFFQLLTEGLKKPKKRKPSKPTKASVQRRLDTKKKISLQKALRKKPNRN